MGEDAAGARVRTLSASDPRVLQSTSKSDGCIYRNYDQSEFVSKI